jgi:hypothetical protein
MFILLDITRTVNVRTHRVVHEMDEKVCRRRLEVCKEARPGPEIVELLLLRQAYIRFAFARS